MTILPIHPAVKQAKEHIKSLGFSGVQRWAQSFNSMAIEKDNLLFATCAETLNRIMEDKPVNDYYVLGLSHAILFIENLTHDQPPLNKTP